MYFVSSSSSTSSTVPSLFTSALTFWSSVNSIDLLVYCLIISTSLSSIFPSSLTSPSPFSSISLYFSIVVSSTFPTLSITYTVIFSLSAGIVILLSFTYVIPSVLYAYVANPESLSSALTSNSEILPFCSLSTFTVGAISSIWYFILFSSTYVFA